MSGQRSASCPRRTGSLNRQRQRAANSLVPKISLMDLSGDEDLVVDIDAIEEEYVARFDCPTLYCEWGEVSWGQMASESGETIAVGRCPCSQRVGGVPRAARVCDPTRRVAVQPAGLPRLHHLGHCRECDSHCTTAGRGHAAVPHLRVEGRWDRNACRLDLAEHHRHMLWTMQPFNSDVDANYRCRSAQRRPGIPNQRWCRTRPHRTVLSTDVQMGWDCIRLKEDGLPHRTQRLGLSQALVP